MRNTIQCYPQKTNSSYRDFHSPAQTVKIITPDIIPVRAHHGRTLVSLNYPQSYPQYEKENKIINQQIVSNNICIPRSEKSKKLFKIFIPDILASRDEINHILSEESKFLDIETLKEGLCYVKKNDNEEIFYVTVSDDQGYDIVVHVWEVTISCLRKLRDLNYEICTIIYDDGILLVFCDKILDNEKYEIVQYI